MTGLKFDNNKPDLLKYFVELPFTKNDFPIEKTNIHDYVLNYNLFPKKVKQEIVSGLSYGAVKYDPENYKYIKNPKIRYLGAALRHLFQWFVLQETYDQESGIHHLALAACSLIFLIDKELK